MKKALLILLLVTILVFMSLGFTAYANEPQGDTIVISEELSLEDLFAKWGVPIVGGTATGLMMLVVAFLKPYLRIIGENKTLKAVYKTTKELYENGQNENSSLRKYQEENSPTVIAEVIKNAVLEEVRKVVREELLALFNKEFNKDKELSGSLLANTEVISEQLNAIIKAASITWANVDGVLPTLSLSPKTAVLDKQAREIQYMKTLVAEKLGMETREIQAMLDKAVNNG